MRDSQLLDIRAVDEAFTAFAAELLVAWVLLVIGVGVWVWWRYQGRDLVAVVTARWPGLAYYASRAGTAVRELADRAFPMPSVAGAAIGFPVPTWSLLTPAQRRDVLARGGFCSLASSADSSDMSSSIRTQPRVLSFGAGRTPATVNVRQAAASPSVVPQAAGAVGEAASVPSPEANGDGLPLFVQVRRSVDCELIARSLHHACVVREHGTDAPYRDETFDELPAESREYFRRRAEIAVQGVNGPAETRALDLISAITPNFERHLALYEGWLVTTPAAGAKGRC